ncbi:MAG: hypothetical protein EA382_15805 [Spirochaetaceae bacterium]|nr:MAG: hypothetical protein EA382_15805 [Spirochaetaceae bacterium]
MALQDEDVRRVGDYMKPWIRDMVREMVPRQPGPIDTQLLERMVRVEEELKAQRELMRDRFDAMDQRFIDMRAHSDARFEAMDQRFVAMRAHSDARFEAMEQRFVAMDQRFIDMRAYTDARFDAVDARFDAADKRFDAADKRFDDALAHSDARFQAVDKRFDDVQASFARTQWLIGLGFVMLTAAITVFGFVG